MRKGRWHGEAVTEGSRSAARSVIGRPLSRLRRQLPFRRGAFGDGKSLPCAKGGVAAQAVTEGSRSAARSVIGRPLSRLRRQLPFRRGAFGDGKKPPLRKGRCHGAAVTEGSRSTARSVKGDPSVACGDSSPYAGEPWTLDRVLQREVARRSRDGGIADYRAVGQRRPLSRLRRQLPLRREAFGVDPRRLL